MPPARAPVVACARLVACCLLAAVRRLVGDHNAAGYKCVGDEAGGLQYQAGIKCTSPRV